MNFLIISPGTGDFYCGVCLRDDALARALHSAGHEVTTMPIYLPLKHEEAESEHDQQIFFGGINVYLQQHSAFFRSKVPKVIDRMLDSSPLLGMAAKMGDMTSPAKLGAMTLSMLMGESGKQRKELLRMIDWLKKQAQPDVIHLSTGLQIGMARELKKQFPQSKIVCSLQGEDDFIDGLEGGYADKCWKEFSARAAEVDLMIAPSQYFANKMADRLQVSPKTIQVLYNGIHLAGYPETLPKYKQTAPTIGFLGRMCYEKGFDILVDAFIALDKMAPELKANLTAIGVLRRSDQKYLATQRSKLQKAGLEDRLSIYPNATREEKLKQLATFSVMSVPARYSEAFGLYIAEALAMGIPCVQPEHAAFPELIHASKGGKIYTPNTPEALSAALKETITNKEGLQDYRASGYAFAHEHLSREKFASAFIELLQ